MNRVDEMDHRLILATQAGLPLVAEPYAFIAGEIGTSEADVMKRLARLMDSGIVRRIALAPNHFRLGMRANGMTVWDIRDCDASRLGGEVGTLPFVSHCYLRPRHRPSWPYNLFAMVHGKTREEVEAKRSEIAALLGEACRQNDILYSTRILKKTGLRLARKGD